MTDQPARVSHADVTALLAEMANLPPDAPLAERLAWHERKARLLSRIAATVDTSEAYGEAAAAWHQCGRLSRQLYAQKDQP